MMYAKEEKFNQNDAKLSHHLTQLLLALGFQIGNLGFNYLKRVIILMRQNHNCTLTDAYAIVGMEENKLPESISSSVRNSIRAAYRQTSFELLECLLGVEMFTSMYSVPAPRELVGLINEYLKVFWNGESVIKDFKKAA